MQEQLLGILNNYKIIVGISIQYLLYNYN